jgi:hypothetical protein
MGTMYGFKLEEEVLYGGPLLLAPLASMWSFLVGFFYGNK